MTLEEAVATLNRNKFWGYTTWKIVPAGGETVVLPSPGGYPMSTEVAMHLAQAHPHDNGLEYATMPTPQPVKNLFSPSAGTLLDLLRNWTDAEKDELVKILGPSLDRYYAEHSTPIRITH